jgi:hypothetical protein
MSTKDQILILIAWLIGVSFVFALGIVIAWLTAP